MQVLFLFFFFFFEEGGKFLSDQVHNIHTEDHTLYSWFKHGKCYNDNHTTAYIFKQDHRFIFGLHLTLVFSLTLIEIFKQQGRDVFTLIPASMTLVLFQAAGESKGKSESCGYHFECADLSILLLFIFPVVLCSISQGKEAWSQYLHREHCFLPLASLFFVFFFFLEHFKLLTQTPPSFPPPPPFFSCKCLAFQR